MNKTNQEYLENNKIHTLLQWVTTDLLQNKPNDPIQFIAKKTTDISQNVP